MKIKTFLSVLFLGLTICLPLSSEVSADPGIFSPEDFGPAYCVGCCDSNGNQLPSDPVCGCDPIDQCGVCNGDGSSCSCELFDCAGNPYPNSIPYCHLDVNKDKRINADDALAIREYIVQHGASVLVNDTNKVFNVSKVDNYITANDELIIINFLNKQLDGVKKNDECDVCGGPGKNICGKCPNDPDFIEPTGPNGLCGCPGSINYVGSYNSECAICTDLPKDSCDRCPGSNGYNSPCNTPTPSPSMTPTPTPSATPTPSMTPVPSPSATPTPVEEVCKYYPISTAYIYTFKGKGAPSGSRTVKGPGVELECVKSIVNKNGGCFSPKKNDDCDLRVVNEFVAIAGSSTSGKVSEFVMDNECNRITEFDKDELFDETYVRGWTSPISLILDDSQWLHKTSIVKFPLADPDVPGLFIWKASDVSPLLVYDPANSNQVLSSTQLFGERTFGGKPEFGIVNSALNSSSPSNGTFLWKDGFEALGQLDSNNDGSVSGEELRHLKLWFDRNMNGISEEGEVVDLASAGITKLFYKGAKAKEGSLDLYLNIGFVQTDRTGRTRIGKSVDWYGEKLDSFKEIALSNQLNTKDYRRFKYSSEMDDLIGVWEWEVDDTYKKESELLKPKGLLMFFKKEESVYGLSAVEYPLKDASGEKVKSIIKYSPIEIVNIDHSSKESVISFNVTNSESANTLSKMTVSNDAAKGHSSFLDDNTNGWKIEYNWKAKKIPLR